MPVVTISAQFGAGAREVGQRLAANLDLDYVDHAVLVEAAQALGVSVSSVEARDERADSLGQRLIGFLERALERSAGGVGGDPFIGAGTLEMMLSQTYQDVTYEGRAVRVEEKTHLDTLTRVITDIADRGNVVVIGRGGQMILRGRPEAVHLQMIADLDVRIRRVQEWESLSEDDARTRILEFRKNRQRFHQRFWSVDVWDPRLYDAVLNTTNLSFEDTAAVAAQIVRAGTVPATG
jgi:cytidylate kinase